MPICVVYGIKLNIIIDMWTTEKEGDRDRESKLDKETSHIPCIESLVYIV